MRASSRRSCGHLRHADRRGGGGLGRSRPTPRVAPRRWRRTSTTGTSEGIRDSGSDTTFFMMQKIGDLYTGAGLYGCTLNSSAGQTLYNSSDPASTTSNEEFFCQSGQNVSTTDVNDNWDRTEVTAGVDDVGSGAGQNQLCAALSTPLTVDFARSSKPSTGGVLGRGRDRLRQGRRADHRLPGQPDDVGRDVDHRPLLGDQRRGRRSGGERLAAR